MLENRAWLKDKHDKFIVIHDSGLDKVETTERHATLLLVSADGLNVR